MYAPASHHLPVPIAVPLAGIHVGGRADHSSWQRGASAREITQTFTGQPPPGHPAVKHVFYLRRMDKRTHHELGSNDALTRGFELATQLLRSPASLRDSVERTIAELVDADAIWLLPAAADAPGVVGRAVRTGMVQTGRGNDLQLVPAGPDASVAAVPCPVDRSHDVTVLLRDGGRPFDTADLTRAVAAVHFVDALHDRLEWSREPDDKQALVQLTRSYWPRAFRLPDGRSVFVRPARTDDQAALLRMHSRCSPDALRRRFIVTEPRLRSRQLLRLVRNDAANAAIVVADGIEVIALANLHLPAAEKPAELAILVEDAFERQDLDFALAAAAADVARSLGRQQLRAEVLAGHSTIERVFRRLGSTRASSPRHGFITLTVDTSDDAAADTCAQDDTGVRGHPPRRPGRLQL